MPLSLKEPQFQPHSLSACLCLACEQLLDWAVHCQFVSAVYDHNVQLQAYSRTTGAQDKDSPPGVGSRGGSVLDPGANDYCRIEGEALGELLPSLL